MLDVLNEGTDCMQWLLDGHKRLSKFFLHKPLLQGAVALVVVFILVLVAITVQKTDNSYISSSQKNKIILPLQILEDPSGSLSIYDILQPDFHQDFSSKKTSFVGGYSRSVFWFKVTLPNLGTHQILEVKPSYLDNVRLYLPDEAGTFVAINNGDFVAYQDKRADINIFAHQNSVFIISIDEPTTVFIRLQTHSSSMAIVTAYSLDGFLESANKEYFYIALVIGLLLSLLIFNILQNIWKEGSVTYTIFMLFIGIQVLAVLAFNGLVGVFFLQNTPLFVSALVSVMVVCIIALTVLLYQRLLEIKWESRPFLFVINLFTYLFSFVVFLSIFFDMYVDTMPFFGLWVLLIYSIWLIESIRMYFEKKAEAVWLMFSATSGLVGSILLLVMLFGWVGLDYLGVYIHQLSLLFTAIGFQFAITLGINRNRNQQIMRKMLYKKLAHKANENRKLQTQFIAMLTHELRTPLSVIRIALTDRDTLSLHLDKAKSAIEDVNRVIDCCVYSDKVDQALIENCYDDLDINAFLMDFKCSSYSQSQIKLDLSNTRLNLRIDPSLLSVVMNNLVDNAVKYGEKNAHVVIGARKVRQELGGGVLIECINRVGKSGYPDEDLIFDKYYRGFNAHRVTGTGLGLYIVKGLTRLMGGEVLVSSNNDTIKFTLRFTHR